ncbi:MAG: protein translocase subunit SecD [Myxococcales bacterium]|nr:protein translocase subunit SecD [Myxococcales bacterium]
MARRCSPRTRPRPSTATTRPRTSAARSPARCRAARCSSGTWPSSPPRIRPWRSARTSAFGFEFNEPQQDSEIADKRPYWRTYYLERAVRLTGSGVSNAMANYDQNTGRPEVLVDFNRFGGRQFGDLTAANVGKKMAIILDDKISSAPVIQGAIRQGRSTITVGGANAVQQEAEAQNLVNVLKTGSLPAPLREESVAELGPTLGRDAVAKAQLAFGLGGVLVILIMLSIYKWSGTIAMAGTILNVVFQMVVMAMFGATLSLPGIAALVLTIGFGVDGNILIYERIRDELLLGKSVKGAVDIGFSRAFSSILDGQLTTAAAGWVLLQYGSGPVHGFAVLLLIGIATTLFVNVWVTRLLFDWYISKKKGELATISI